ncbi:MAG: calcium/sodium antiporter [bacterium]
MLTYFLFILGFIIIIKGADYLVDGASLLAKKLKVSDLVIGLTVVAFGTSMPELFVNIFACLRGNTEIAIGNILGSNTFNILIILGISSIIRPITVGKGTVWKEIPLSLLAAVMVWVLANDVILENSTFSSLGRIDGLVLLSFFIIFLYYIASISKEPTITVQESQTKEMPNIKILFMLLAGFIGLFLGGKWIVEGAEHIAVRLGLSQSFVGFTIVAAGTSFPELATSIVATYKKNMDIAVGNVVGSNIFNIFLILGISAAIKPLPFNKLANADIVITIVASLFLFFAMFTGKKKIIDRWEGILFILFYIAYITTLAVW